MDNTQEISLTDTQRHWLEHLRACEASGEDIAAYAAEYGLDAGDRLRARLKSLAEQYSRYRYPTLHAMLKSRGWRSIPRAPIKD